MKTYQILLAILVISSSAHKNLSIAISPKDKSTWILCSPTDTAKITARCAQEGLTYKGTSKIAMVAQIGGEGLFHECLCEPETKTTDVP